MKKTEMIVRKQEITTDVICDMCGDSCLTERGVVSNEERLDHGENYYNFDYLEIRGHFGYHSNKDGETWNAEICQFCADKLDKLIIFDKDGMFGGKEEKSEFKRVATRKRKILNSLKNGKSDK